MEFESPEDPFELDVLQEPVFFTIDPIKPLENYPWDNALPGMSLNLRSGLRIISG